MRNVHAALATMLVIVLGGGRAAKAQPAPSGKEPPQRLILQRGQLGSQEYVDTALSRLRSGDCAGALDAFDAAMRTRSEPTLYRDRGLCHEKLGHPYPAMDDFRRYLTQLPDAPDAASIRERLTLLEDKTSGRVHGASDDDDSPFAKPKAPAAAAGGAGAAGATRVKVEATGVTSTRVDTMDEDDEELHASLRHGKGFSVGPFIEEHKWLQSTVPAGQTWSENLGLQLRYSLGARSAVLAEVAYELFNSTNIDPVTGSGFNGHVAFELRLPLDGRYENQILVVPGVSYEHLFFSPTDPNSSSYSIGGVGGRLRVGWRHMIAGSTSIEFALGGGIVEFFDFTAPTNAATPRLSGPMGSGLAGLAGATVALAWGL